jgi:hypothetical protein
LLFIEFHHDGRVQPVFWSNPDGGHPASQPGGASACPNS